MANEYELKELRELIEKIRPKANINNKWMVNYLRLQALFVYFQYAVASVRLQEENIQKMEGGQHKNFATHGEYEDCLLKLYSSAVTAYSNLRTCLNFSYAIVKNTPKQTEDFKRFRVRYKSWAKELIDKRDRITAHPEEKDRIVWKPNMWSSDGRVGFRTINSKSPKSSRQIILEPRMDLEKLKLYLSELASHLEKLWDL